MTPARPADASEARLSAEAGEILQLLAEVELSSLLTAGQVRRRAAALRARLLGAEGEGPSQPAGPFAGPGEPPTYADLADLVHRLVAWHAAEAARASPGGQPDLDAWCWRDARAFAARLLGDLAWPPRDAVPGPAPAPDGVIVAARRPRPAAEGDSDP